MAKVNGYGGSAKLGSNAIGEVEEWSFDKQVQLFTGVAKGESRVKGAVGPITATGTLVVFTDPDDTNGQGAIAAGSILTDLNLYLDGEATGDYYYTSTEAIVMGEGVTDPMDYSKTTYQLHFNDGPTRTTVS